MNYSDISTVCQLISSVFNNTLTNNILAQLDLTLSGANLQEYASNETLLDHFTPVKKIIVLIKGNVQIHNYNMDGAKSIQGIMPAPDFFGLIEALTDMPIYTSKVIADGPVTALSIPIPLFKEALHTNLELANIVVQKMAEFSSQKMMESMEIKLYKPMDSLIFFLYKYANNKALPLTIEMKRSDLSSLLHIELRTLYRYLDTIKTQQLCTITHGKLMITQKNFSNLNDYIREFELI